MANSEDLWLSNPHCLLTCSLPLFQPHLQCNNSNCFFRDWRGTKSHLPEWDKWKKDYLLPS